MLNNLAIIPARGGSKRIKNKNIIDFHGRPMIAYVLDNLQRSNLFDKIHVSTDSEDIKKIVEELGFTVDFLRPMNLADDSTGIVPVLQWVLERYEEEGIKFENICCALPTAPLVKSSDFIESYNVYIKNKRNNPLHAVSKMPVPIEWTFRMHSDGVLMPIMQEMLKKRSQDLEEAYYDAGAFSWFPISYFSSEIQNNHKFISYVLDRHKSIDIDNLEDLEFAKKLYEISLNDEKNKQS